jgi:hypothetical protein
VAQPPQAFIAGPAELQKRPIFRTPTSSDRKLVYHWNTADGLPLKSGELGSYPDSGNSKGGRPACPSGSRVLLPLVAVRSGSLPAGKPTYRLGCSSINGRRNSGASGATIDSKIWAWARRRSMKRGVLLELECAWAEWGHGLARLCGILTGLTGVDRRQQSQ